MKSSVCQSVCVDSMSSHGPERGVSSVTVLYIKGIISNFLQVSCCSGNTFYRTATSKSFSLIHFSERKKFKRKRKLKKLIVPEQNAAKVIQ